MTWIVAHRGAASEFAEHTPAAFQRAIDLGADAVECDVRLTRDGVVVLAHDATMQRTAASKLRVSTSTITELRSLDVGSWHERTAIDADASISDEARRSVMSLYELLELLEAQSRDVGLLVETKHPARNGKALEPYVARVLSHFGWDKPRATERPPVAVMSFSRAALTRIAQAAPDVARVALASPPLSLARATTLAHSTQSLGPSVVLLQRNPEWIRSLVRNGRELFVWTVDSDADFDAAVGLGATAIITNRPRWALARRDQTV